MIPQRLRLKDFMTYAADEEGRAIELDFSHSPLWSISGPNGAGKSVLFDGVTWCLFGQHRGGKQQAERLVRQGQKQGYAELDLRVGSDEYRLSRHIKLGRSGRSSQERSVSRWDSATESWKHIPDTQSVEGFDAFVSNELHLRYETFIASTMLRQGQSETLIAAKPADRFEILAGIVDLAVFQKFGDRADRCARDDAREAKRLELELETAPLVSPRDVQAARDELDRLRDAHQDAKAALAQAEVTLANARRFAESSAARTGFQGELGAVETLLAERERIEADHRELEDLDEVRPKVARVLELLDDVEKHEAAAEQTLKSAGEIDLQDLGRHRSEARRDLDDAVKLMTDLSVRAASTAERLNVLTADAGEAEEYAEQAQKWRDLKAEASLLRAQVGDLDEARRALADKELLGDAAPHAQRILGLDEQLRTREEAANDAGDPDQLARRKDELTFELAAVIERGSSASAVVERAREVRIRADAQRDALEAELGARSDAAGEQTCSRCGQPITPQHIEAEKARVRDAIAAIEQERTRLTLEEGSARALAEEIDADRLRVTSQISDLERSYTAAMQAAAEAATARRICDEALAAVTDLGPELQNAITAAVRDGPEGVGACLAAQTGLKAAREQVASLALKEDRAGRLERQAEDVERWLEARPWLASDLERERRRSALSAARTDHDALRGELLAAQQKHREASTAATSADAEYERARERQTGLQRAADGERAKAVACRAAAEAMLKVESPWGQRVRSSGSEALDELDQRRAELAAAPDRKRRLDEAKERQSELSARLATLDSELDRIPTGDRRRPEDAEAALLQAKEDEAAAQRAAMDAELRLHDLERKGKEWNDLAVAVRSATRKAELARRLADLLGRHQLQAHLLDGAARSIQTFANDMLGRTSHGELELVVQVRPEDGEQHIVMDVIDHGSGDEPQDLQFVSGGQKFRVAVALASAIGQATAGGGRSGRSLIVDEGFGSLDVEGRREMIEELRALAAHMDRIIVVSHHEEFWDATLFPSGYRIVKKDRKSVVEPRV